MFFPCSSVGKESACNAGDPSLIPGSGISPGEGNGTPLQYSCLQKPMDKRAWQATIHGVARVGHDLETKPPPNFLQHIFSPKPVSYQQSLDLLTTVPLLVTTSLL